MRSGETKHTPTRLHVGLHCCAFLLPSEALGPLQFSKAANWRPPCPSLKVPPFGQRTGGEFANVIYLPSAPVHFEMDPFAVHPVFLFF